MNKKVLTVDDSKTLRMIIGKHLAPFGVQLLQAENGEQCLVSARQNTPDLILLDYNMPVMDGYHTLVELKTDPNLKSIPVVMLTTETVKETVLKLVKLGLKDYIAKPFTREVLLEKINPILGLYEGNGFVQEKAAAGLQEVSVDSANPTILAVDDKSNILDMLKEYIGAQYNIITADSGQAAVNAVATRKFEYMILDLSMPEVNGFDVLDSYLQSGRNGANTRRVAVMTLRTAQEDIDKAISMGISAFLYKPFNRDDVAKVLDKICLQQQKKEEKTVRRYLTSSGKVRILECPSADKGLKSKEVASALKAEIMLEVNEMAEEGLSQLIIRVGDGFLSDLAVMRKFVDLIEHIVKLSLNVRLVADSSQTRDSLKQFAETASLPTDMSMEMALGAFQ
jgi:two-component system, cell cycle response regulator